jgi:hypothetical protein
MVPRLMFHKVDMVPRLILCVQGHDESLVPFKLKVLTLMCLKRQMLHQSVDSDVEDVHCMADASRQSSVWQ